MRVAKITENTREWSIKIYQSDSLPTIRKEREMIKQEIEITGMSCGHCEGKVVKELLHIAGVSEATASSDSGLALLTSDHEVSLELIQQAVEQAGYKVTAAITK